MEANSTNPSTRQLANASSRQPSRINASAEQLVNRERIYESHIRTFGSHARRSGMGHHFCQQQGVAERGSYAGGHLLRQISHCTDVKTVI